MTSLARPLAGALAVSLSLLGGIASAAEPPERRPVDLCICLDTSGSMEGLLDSARRKLWDITNELALAKPTPKLRVALLTFGNDGHSPESGWVRIDSPFTEDLDAIYKKLFALTTNGGTEFVGRVVKTSIDQLAWTDSKDALKVIFVAGNESADQDQTVRFQQACELAVSKGVVVNAIYCGRAEDGIAPGWRQVALLGKGHFASIDQNKGTVEVATPFDGELSRLSTALNATYIPFGAAGEEGRKNQTAQDANAAGTSGSSSASRANAKASELYRCKWDLVDACRDKEADIEKLSEKELPENMRKMTLEERKAYVKAMQEKRAAVQKEIADLHAKRQGFIAEELKKLGKAEDSAFDAAVRKAIQEQARTKGFTFEKK